MDRTRFRDKTVLVTGGGRGIGRGCSDRFRAEGAEVIVAQRSECPDFFTVTADFCDPDAPRRVIDAVIDRTGRLDILINNAGMMREAGLETMIHAAGFDASGTILFILLIVFLLGFVLDWIEITLIVLPLMRPIVNALGLDIPGFDVIDEPALVWFVILVAVTLQTSFLTPPVGFALFYLKGVCPPEVKLKDIYKGVVPFVILQLIGLGFVFAVPELATWLPSIAFK